LVKHFDLILFAKPSQEGLHFSAANSAARADTTETSHLPSPWLRGYFPWPGVPHVDDGDVGGGGAVEAGLAEGQDRGGPPAAPRLPEAPRVRRQERRRHLPRAWKLGPRPSAASHREVHHGPRFGSPQRGWRRSLRKIAESRSGGRGTITLWGHQRPGSQGTREGSAASTPGSVSAAHAATVRPLCPSPTAGGCPPSKPHPHSHTAPRPTYASSGGPFLHSQTPPNKRPPWAVGGPMDLWPEWTIHSGLRGWALNRAVANSKQKCAFFCFEWALIWTSIWRSGGVGA